MLRGELYDIVSVESEGAITRARIHLRPESVIYKAHFEGMPITPGMCILSIASELSAKGSLTAAKDIRFLAPIEPGNVTELLYTMEETSPGKISVIVSAALGDSVFSKMNLSYE
ncbi:MAG: hypothetical protein IKR69_00205 [Bacteroidales bacterium]|nr:hypothetical protein [Bacteroidales bacterium]